MSEISLKVMLRPNLLFERICHGMVGSHHFPAMAADKVEVRTVLRSCVYSLSLSKVGADEQALFHQHFQGAVHGGDIDGLGASTDQLQDILCGEMSGGVSDGFDDDLPLGGDAVAALAQFFKAGMIVGHSALLVAKICNSEYYNLVARVVKWGFGRRLAPVFEMLRKINKKVVIMGIVRMVHPFCEK